MKKQYVWLAVVTAAVLSAAGCSSSKKETEAPAPETKEEVQTEALAVSQTESEEEMYLDLTGIETEEDDWETEDGWETEEDFWDDEDFWETESEYDFYYDYDETETEAEVIPRPEYEVKDYLTIEDDDYTHMTVQVAPAQQVTDEEIDTEISDSFYYLEEYDDLIVKKTEGTVANGDTVNIDYVGKKDGEAFEGGTDEGYDLVIGSGSFISGFEEGLIGKEIGSTVDLNLTFPEDYGVEELNGADVVFTVTINYVTQMPEFTDEIAQKLSDGEYQTIDEYRESIRAELQTSYDDEYRESVSAAVMEKLLQMYPVSEYPQANVDYNVQMILSQYIEPYASMYGMSTEDFVEAAYGVPYDEFMEEQVIPSAQQFVAQEIVLGVIADKEGITMTQEELEERLQGYADQYGVEIEDIVSGQDMSYIRENELDQKVMTWLSENAAVELVSETEAEMDAGTEAETGSAGTEEET